MISSSVHSRKLSHTSQQDTTWFLASATPVRHSKNCLTGVACRWKKLASKDPHIHPTKSKLYPKMSQFAWHAVRVPRGNVDASNYPQRRYLLKRILSLHPLKRAHSTKTLELSPPVRCPPDAYDLSVLSCILFICFSLRSDLDMKSCWA